MDPIKELLSKAEDSGYSIEFYLLAEIAVQVKRLADKPETVNYSTDVVYASPSETKTWLRSIQLARSE